MKEQSKSRDGVENYSDICLAMTEKILRIPRTGRSQGEMSRHATQVTGRHVHAVLDGQLMKVHMSILLAVSIYERLWTHQNSKSMPKPSLENGVIFELGCAFQKRHTDKKPRLCPENILNITL